MTMRAQAADGLRGKVEGKVILPHDSGYNAARQVWNAMVDKRPAVIVQCATADDAGHALAFGRANGLEIAIRGAGHNIAGSALSDNGLVIDFSAMRGVRIDAAKRRAYVEPGATLADFDKEAQAHGLATPVGINSTTGIAGLTLGGGFGWLTRQYGMTIDNLISAETITADGQRLTASQARNSDLFWALRGGGGNFAIVTRFEFVLHPVGPSVMAGLVVFPFEQARSVLSNYRELAATAPRELNVWIILRKAPQLPFLPESVHGKEVVAAAVFHGGEESQDDDMARRVRELGKPCGEHVGRQPYTQWQQTFDPLLAAGARNYWKSHNFTELSEGALDTMIDYAGRQPSPQCEIFVGLIAGATNDVPADAMAWGHRDARFVMNVHGRWENQAVDEQCVGWARSFFEAVAPHASGGAYVNFMTAEESGRVAAAYGNNYGRLVEIKRKYDPGNVFHVNQNIRP